MSVNDLPTACKVSGTAGHGSDSYCTVCDCYSQATIYNSDLDKWKLRDVTMMCQQVEAWWDAQNSKERDEIFTKYGVWRSEFWRLPYWNPSHMLVIDSMYCILEGLIHYHCHYVLELYLKQAKASLSVVPAFSHLSNQYSPDVPQEYCVKHDQGMKQISELHNILVLPIGCNPGSTTEDELRVKLMGKILTPLKFVYLFSQVTNRGSIQTKLHYSCKNKEAILRLIDQLGEMCPLIIHLDLLIHLCPVPHQSPLLRWPTS
jgi:hypothetical protein